MTKYLMLFDIAGYTGVLGNQLRKEGHTVKIFTQHDTFNYHEVYPIIQEIPGSKYHLCIKVLLELLLYRPNILWIHYYDKKSLFFAILKKLFRFQLYFTAHGSSTRLRTDFSCYKHYDKVFTVTRDLQNLLDLHDIDTIYMPNTIDEMVLEHKTIPKLPLSALFVVCSKKDLLLVDKIDAYCKKKKLFLTVWNRLEQFLPYKDYLDFVACYEYYFEIKDLQNGSFTSPYIRSKNGLEAEALGAKILYLKDVVADE